ncbi:MAG: hypothetical protein H0Z34_05245 [Brevibacillus sp.]|nr:hypothetical protein [Brevibacillus sp.]
MHKQKKTRSRSVSASLVADYKTKRLCKRIQPGRIVLLHHEDIDEVAAESLLEARVLAVINTAPFMTGSYPACGAKRLLDADVPLYEVVQADVDQLMQLPDETPASIVNHQLYIQTGGRSLVVPLRMITPSAVEEKWQEAQARLDQTLSRFIDNTLQYAQVEKDFFLKPLPIPRLAVKMANRHVVVVVRGKHYRDDLQMLYSYIKEYRPVLIAVDGGADALIEAGYLPDVIIGDMDSVTDRALRCGAEVVVHAYPDGRAPGRERMEQLGVPYHILPAPGTSEDVAMLMAYEEQAELIVTIGTHTNMIDFLEKGRKGMASTLLVRTKIGPRLIDAKGVSQLYQPRVSWNTWLLFTAAALVPVGAILAVNPITRHVAQMIWKQWTMMMY